MEITMQKRIFINQCGYQPSMKKSVTFCAKEPVPFVVRHPDGQEVFHGVAERRVETASAGEVDFVGDFSGVTKEGLYYITAEGFGESDTFAIREDVFDGVFQKAMAFYYFQRCGKDLPENAADIYAHKACHTGLARVYGKEEVRRVTGGWHDAGDYGRYVGPGAMAVAQLLYAYERNEELCTGYHSPERVGFIAASLYPKKGICKSDGLPAQEEPAVGRSSLQKNETEAFGQCNDFLDEVKYELDWMLKMQREDGALYHKATCAQFCAFIMPENETEDIFLSPVSVTATADFAAASALASRIYEKYDTKYADQLKAASIKAYEAMKTMELPGGFKNPEGITTGMYGDPCDKDERYWAAAELYKTFGEEKYRADFETLVKEKIYHGYGWIEMGSYGNQAYLSTEYPVDKELKAKIQKDMVSLADKVLENAEKDGYGTALSEMQYVWGSNLAVATSGLYLFDAWKLTGELKYLDAASEQLHSILGRNPMGVCYITGCGASPFTRPHHRPSGVVGKALPGMLISGPCRWMADQTIKSMLPQDTSPAKCIVDMMGSYSTTEVAIYWNSAFLMLLASVME